jgi:hypothetical protein
MNDLQIPSLDELFLWTLGISVVPLQAFFEQPSGPFSSLHSSLLYTSLKQWVDEGSQSISKYREWATLQIFVLSVSSRGARSSTSWRWMAEIIA